MVKKITKIIKGDKEMGLSRRDFIKGTAASALGISSIGLLASCTRLFGSNLKKYKS